MGVKTDTMRKGKIGRRHRLGLVIALAAFHGLTGVSYGASPVITAGSAPQVQRGWNVTQEGTYYRDANGQRLTGEQVVDGKAYTFSPDGWLVREGIHRDGLEDDILSQALVLTVENWEETQHMIALINEERQKVGLALVAPDFSMSVAATYRCIHMDRYQYLGHDYNGVSQGNAVGAAYLGRACGWGENYYYFGDVTRESKGLLDELPLPEFTVQAHAWLCQSPTHYENITFRGVTKVGAGFYYNPDRTMGYTVNLFGL